MTEGDVQPGARRIGAKPSARGTSAVAKPGRRAVSLVPREHGTYGQLLFPLAVAHLTGSPSWAAWLFTVAAAAAFSSHEPLLIVLGRRGERARLRGGPRALRWLCATAGVGATAVVAGLALAPTPARWSALACVLLALPLVVQIARGSERSLVGELLVASLLATSAVPVALSAGVPAGTAVAVWLVWTLGFAAATFVVRDITAHFKRGRPLFLRVAPLAASAAVAGLASVLGLLQRAQLVALTPLLVTLLAVAVRPPHPRHLRRMGWTLIAASATTAALLIA